MEEVVAEGAQGPHAALINGKYRLIEGKILNNNKVWGKVGDSNRFIARGQNGRWNFQDSNDLGKEMGTAWCTGMEHPTPWAATGDWNVFVNTHTELQPNLKTTLTQA